MTTEALGPAEDVPQPEPPQPGVIAQAVSEAHAWVDDAGDAAKGVVGEAVAIPQELVLDFAQLARGMGTLAGSTASEAVDIITSHAKAMLALLHHFDPVPPPAPEA